MTENPTLSAPRVPPSPGAESSFGRRCRFCFLGRRPYAETFALQERLRRAIRSGEGSEWLLLLEHDPVFTVGRNANGRDVLAAPSWLASRGITVHETNRGGQVTYHGPGQLVGYPIIDLNPDRRDIGRYVRDLQEVLIRTLAHYGLEAQRREGKEFIGLWLGDGKIASIGVHLSRWITLHGFALNVTTQLEHFGGIVACGLPGVKMVSLAQFLAEPPSLPELAQTVAREFAQVFGRQLEESAASLLDTAAPVSPPSEEPAANAQAEPRAEGGP